VVVAAGSASGETSVTFTPAIGSMVVASVTTPVITVSACKARSPNPDW
jgi:hypothetical protein